MGTVPIPQGAQIDNGPQSVSIPQGATIEPDNDRLPRSWRLAQPTTEESGWLQQNPGYSWLPADNRFPNREPGIYPTSGPQNAWRTNPNSPNASSEQHPVDLHLGRHMYESGKMAVAGATLPLTFEATAPQIIGGFVGGTVGSIGGQKIAQAAGAGPTGQEVAGDVGGLVGGFAGAGAGNWTSTTLGRLKSAFDALPDELKQEALGMLSPGLKQRLASIQNLRAGYQKLNAPTNAGGPLLQGSALMNPGAAPPPAPADVLGGIPVRPGAAGSMAQSVVGKNRPTSTLSDLRGVIDQTFGVQPLQKNVPLRMQQNVVGTSAPPTPQLPEGFTPAVNANGQLSSALKGYKYDPANREFSAITSGGQHYIWGDVDPEEAAAFEAADSKGQAWQDIKQNPLVGKVINGKRIAVKPVVPKGAPQADLNEGDDLMEQLRQTFPQRG